MAIDQFLLRQTFEAAHRIPSTLRPRVPAGANGSRKIRGCLPKQAMDHGPRQHRQTAVQEKSELREGWAGAILMFGRFGIKIAARTMCYGRQPAGGKRQLRLSARLIKRP
eukprot:362057-Chlamydomonas_euryale.AAC.14